MKDEALTLEEAKELYRDYNWSLDLCHKNLKDKTITLAQFSRIIVGEGLNEIHFEKLHERKTTVEKTNYFKSDVMKVRGEDVTLDEDSFFGDIEGMY